MYRYPDVCEAIVTRLLFLKSWHEWAEGNYVEPDMRFGRGFLEALRDEVGAVGRQGW